MKKWSLLFSFILTILVFTGCKKQPFTNPYPFNPDLYGQSSYTPAINAAIKTEMSAGKIPGVAVGVIKKNKIEFLKGYGIRYNNFPVNDTPKITPQTNFYNGDLATSVVMMAVMQLHDQNLLDADADINMHLPFAFSGAQPE